MESTVFICGNGNISFDAFAHDYLDKIKHAANSGMSFVLCDFRGADILSMEVLKTLSANVTICHVGSRPRYTPDKYKTFVSKWKFIGGFLGDADRDDYAANLAKYIIAADYNSDENRKSGTRTNIEKFLSSEKLEYKIN